jgi:hypothetical protein
VVLHNPLGDRPCLFPALYRKPLRTPFIGRQNYLDLFVQMLREVRAGQPLVLFLQGEAGMGKSRLLEEFQARVQRQGFVTAGSRCREQFSVPYWPFVAFLQPLGEHFATIGAPFQSHDLERLHAFLQGAFPRPLRNDPPVPGQAEQEQLGLYLAISRALIGLARHQPILVMIDDVHWADTLSLELLNFLVFTLSEQASQAAVPLLLVVAHRPPQPGAPLEAFLHSLLREDICSSLDLDGLQETELMAILKALGIDQPAPQLLHTVEDITQGNPLFGHEVFYYLEQRQVLQERQGLTEATLTATDLRLPTQMTESMIASLCRFLLRTVLFIADICMEIQPHNTLCPAIYSNSDSRPLLSDTRGGQVRRGWQPLPAGGAEACCRRAIPRKTLGRPQRDSRDAGGKPLLYRQSVS